MGSEGAVSRLYIANANKQDTGNYSCALADIAATTVSVHVLNGKYHSCNASLVYIIWFQMTLHNNAMVW